MSHRTRMLSLWMLVIGVGGFIGWSMQPATLIGQDQPENEIRILEPQPPDVEVQRTNDIPAPPPGRAEGNFDFSVPSQNEENIQNALRNPRGVDIEFIDTPLRDAMDFIADAHNITIIIDEQALNEEGVTVDEPINRILSGVKLESALKIILEPLGLTHIMENEVLKITTNIAAYDIKITRVYNTGYLRQIGVEPDGLRRTIENVIAPNEWRNPPQGQTATPPPETASVRNTSGGSELPNRGTTLFLRTVQQDEPQNQNRKPPANAQRGTNSIEVLGDMLVVSAPQSVHEKIRQLLIQVDRRWEQQQERN